jgi:AraC-like DNA-binding protein
MPSAAPIPRGPTVLTLATAAELLTGPGCPVCRYAAEASDRYLAWFAVEAHADPVTITRLCASLGMCPWHTRALMRQPGAATRLTAVYRYLLEAARQQLAGHGKTRPACPACEHDQACARRALGTLLEGLAEPPVQRQYLAAGGLCVPHARDAAGMRGHRAAGAWAVRATVGALGGPPGLDALAGGPDHDAAERARLRAALPPPGRASPGCCPVCAAAAGAESRELARVARAGYGVRPGDPDLAAPVPGPCLCAGHLRDAVLMTTRAPALLAWQAGCLSADLARRMSAAGRRRIPAGWLPGRDARRPGTAGCPVCLAAGDAARQELARFAATRRAVPPGAGGRLLCVRHVLALRVVDAAATQAAADLAARRAATLLRELAEAFRKGTWAHRHEPRGPEMNAWRRAAVFLDGGVSGGCPPWEG